jgi:hypothetical protein
MSLIATTVLSSQMLRIFDIFEVFWKVEKQVIPAWLLGLDLPYHARRVQQVTTKYVWKLSRDYDVRQQ